MSDLNHWNAWISDENNLKVNTAPGAELIAGALTTGYLQPRLRASGVEDWANRSEEHTSELQSLMRISYAVFCLKKKKRQTTHHNQTQQQHLLRKNQDN